VRVSFIIPLYNCLPLTQAMLKSLQATLPDGLDHEILFVDDGSTDGTREWLETIRSARIRVVLNERNLGYAAANNRAVAQASGDLLVLLNNDLVLTPRWLGPMLDIHTSLGTRAGVIGNVQRAVASGEIDHTGIVIGRTGKPEHDRTPPSRFARIKKVSAVTGACLLISRSLWQQLGGFDEAFVNGGEDIDLCFKARAAGREIAVALRSVVFHHVSSSPGRRLRDEHNSRLLTHRWRRQLSELGARARCRDYLVREATAGSAFFAPWESLQIAFHAADLTRRPPTPALRLIADALDVEEARWEQLLGKESPAQHRANPQ